MDGGDNTFFGTDTDDAGTFPNFSGTSAAAAHAAGVAALIREAATLEPMELTRLLQRTALDMKQRAPRLSGGEPTETGPGCDPDSGAGLIDAYAALDALGQIDADHIGVWHPGDRTFDFDEVGNLSWDNCVVGAPAFGTSTDKPVSGDWNGDGYDEIGVWRPGNATFYLDSNGNYRWDNGSDAVVHIGSSTDLPVVGDWNADGRDDLGVWRPGTHTFYLRTGTEPDKTVSVFGIDTDLPVVGDWNGDGRDDIGVWRPGTGTFYLDANGNSAWDKGIDTVMVFGMIGDLPFSGDWDGDGSADVGVWRPSNNGVYLDADGNHAWDKTRDIIGRFGEPGDKPLIGRWARYRLQQPR